MNDNRTGICKQRRLHIHNRGKRAGKACGAAPTAAYLSLSGATSRDLTTPPVQFEFD